MAIYTVANLGDVLFVSQVVTGTANVVLTEPTTFVAMRQSVATSVTITLPPNVPTGYPVLVKDSLGVCSSHNFTVNTSDSSLIDGHSTFVMIQNFQSQIFIFDGIGWGVNG